MAITPTEQPEITLDGFGHHYQQPPAQAINFNTLLLIVKKHPQIIQPGALFSVRGIYYKVEQVVFCGDEVGDIQQLIVDFITQEGDPKLELEES